MNAVSIRLGALLLVAAGVAVGGGACGSSEGAAGPRRGEAGDSCTRTDDCAEPLACVRLTCQIRGGAGGGASSASSASSAASGGGPATASSAASTASSASSASSSAMSSSGTGLDPMQCHACLAAKCKTQLAACDGACLSVEACLEATCFSLSSQGSPDEGKCQVHCQTLFPAGKQHHLDVVNCAQFANCGPCSNNPIDYDACRKTADAGPCASSKAACLADANCTTYRTCLKGCTTLAACLACQNGQSGMAGYTLDDDYETCIATECIAESWLP